MNINLAKTVNDKDFNQVFTEVFHSEGLGVHANSELRLFRLKDVTDFHFSQDNLLTFLERNIGRYVFSRSKLEKFHLDGDDHLVGIKALDIMHKNGAADQRGTGNEMGEILLYAFLETVLGAPKIYSKVELTSAVKSGTSSSDGMHIKVLSADDTSVTFEMVFGVSSVVGGFDDAINNAFDHIQQVNSRTSDEIQIVNSTIFELPEDDPVVRELRPIIKPEPNKQVNRDSAFGVFVGYYLAELVSKGVAYHIGYLPASIRQRIERLFHEGAITAIFCTSTLVEGVNLPADNLFITDFKNGLSHMSAIDFRNLIGRVGRLEYNLYGNVFLVAINEKASEKYVSRLQEEIPEQSLSVEKELTRPQKKHVIKTLLSGTIVIDKQLKSQSPDSYDLMRKFAIILLNDILKNRQSKVRSEFVALMQPGEEDKIRQLFSKKEVQPDDDITVSIDQTESLYEAITFNGLEFPQVDDNGEFDGKELLPFLERLCGIFKWERYESDTLGHVGKDSQKHGKLSWYSVILSQWVRGAGLNQIMFQAIDQKRKHPTNAMFDRTTRKYYDYTDTLRDRNDVISDVLNVIDKIILFKFSNYFLKVAKAYKEIRGQDPKDNWYEFVEYGSTNKRAIAIQKHGFSRESAMYILRQGQKYIAADEPELRLHRSILECPNKGVRNDADMIQYNIPDLFVD